MKHFNKAAEDYFTELARLRASGAGTGERSSYPALATLLNAIGATLKPKIFCIQEPADQGAGHPDFALFSAKQIQKGRPKKGQVPERGVVEVKAPDKNPRRIAEGSQVIGYWDRYRLVLVTNTYEFVLVGEDSAGQRKTIEAFTLAGSEDEFNRLLETPRAFARKAGVGLGEYLARALSHRAYIVEPKDLAWLLASYARDALARVESAGDTSALVSIRSALEEALGIQFEDERGEHFFRSTLIQTLFYGVFSAWVLWARQKKQPTGTFNWHEAVWHLRTPVLEALFRQLSSRTHLQSLNLVEVLDWTAATLDRVARDEFLARFGEGEAVPYFYEPFLEAFDPKLRKQLGVWYTPTDIVRYMVARVDKALKEDLGIADGLAAENVYVLDPCCGTGAYLAEVLRRIAINMENRGLGALTGARVKQAATERVFGFEIMPAPFVVAHLQVGLTMQELDAPLADDANERPGVFLTNALTGWEPHVTKPKPIVFPELEQERERAENVKQKAPILVILGNPPYNGFAGMAVEEERTLSNAYRITRRVRRPEGQGLNDLYVRFFCMAERRIRKDRGVVCFISNYSWLDGLSFTGMRERFLEVFDAIRIDCLNGDKYKTGKVAPDGSPDPSIFSTEGDPVGIQVGTAIATLVRKADHVPATEVGFRHFWGQAKREELTATAEADPENIYENVEPILPLGLPFARVEVSDGWFDWPALPDLLPMSFPGVKSGRDPFVVDIDLNRLKERIGDYFDTNLSHEEIERRYPTAMRNPREYDARTVRDTLLMHGGPVDSGFLRYTFRPFDNRWLYWEDRAKLVDRPRPEYRPHVFEGNLWLVLQNKARPDLSPPLVISNIGDLNQMNSGVYCVPAWLSDNNPGISRSGLQRHPNLSGAAQDYLKHLGVSVEDLFYHILAVLHDPSYNQVNADVLRAGGPRIPLTGWPDGKADGAAEALAASAMRGFELAQLLDSDKSVPGITQGTLRPEIAALAVPTTNDGHNMIGDDFALTAGWGHFGQGSVVMPGRGYVVERPYTPEERAILGDIAVTFGESTFDIYLNDHAYWRNVPAAIWNYKLGGYQVLKKWLSYREQDVLDRPLKPQEVQHFADTARRIAAILLLTSTPLS